MPRLLLHPLREAGIGSDASVGQWETLNAPDELTRIDFPENNPGLGEHISSIPSPWARLELFRDSVIDAPSQPADRQAHPFSEEAVQDILDSLEVLLFQDWLDGVSLAFHKVDLSTLVEAARRELSPLRFLEAAEALAPSIGVDRLKGLTIVTGMEGRVLFASSPFTLFFTPEDRSADIPGYFADRRISRPLSQRPPELASYIQHRLLPMMARHEDQIEEIIRLSGIFQSLLESVPPSHRQSLPPDILEEREALLPLPDVGIGKLTRRAWTGPLTLLPTRNLDGPAPLVIHDTLVDADRGYYPWAVPRRGTRICDARTRHVLPGSPWRVQWLDPEREFLVERLLVLQRCEVDVGNVEGSVIYENAATTTQSKPTSQLLLPLTPQYFEYFTVADVSKHLRLSSDPDGQITATLTVPTVGGDRVFRRTYSRGSDWVADTFFLSVWPSFAPAENAFQWPYYAVLHNTVGASAEEDFEISIGVGGKERSRTRENPDEPVRMFKRQSDTAFYYVDQPPEYLRIRRRNRPGAVEAEAEGILLPRFDRLPAPTLEPWKIAIDFGTSNTVIATRRVGQEQAEVFHLRDAESATRRDLIRSTSTPATNAALDESVRTFDTFFFPQVLPPEPFPTVVLRSQAATGAPPRLQNIPGLTANIPFTGDVMVSGNDNALVADLKWGGGVRQAERTSLTESFLKQIMLMVHAESIRRGFQVNPVELRWSYPAAFSPEEKRQLFTRWQTVLDWARTAQLGSPDGELIPEAQSKGWLPDESNAALWFFKTQHNFSINADPLALTVDLGGGTTDIAGYGRQRDQFRSSVLLGGRDLIGWPSGESPDAPLNPLYRYIERWVEGQLAGAGAYLQPLQQALVQYPTSHGKFSFLVRHPWFRENRKHLVEEDWFRHAQVCVAYLFASIFYYAGLLVRTDRTDGVDYDLPDRVILGGNGSRYLEWLTGFLPWYGSEFAPPYEKIFNSAFRAGYGGDSPTLRILTSSAPKKEVAIGLLTDDASRAIEARLKTLDADAEDRQAETGTVGGRGARILRPIGETSVFKGGSSDRLVQPTEGVELDASEAPLFELGADYPGTSIATFNLAFLEQLGSLQVLSSNWISVRDQVEASLGGCDRAFYTRAVRDELSDRMRFVPRISPSIFTMEVAVTLRRLETKLFPEGKHAGR